MSFLWRLYGRPVQGHNSLLFSKIPVVIPVISVFRVKDHYVLWAIRRIETCACSFHQTWARLQRPAILMFEPSITHSQATALMMPWQWNFSYIYKITEHIDVELIKLIASLHPAHQYRLNQPPTVCATVIRNYLPLKIPKLSSLSISSSSLPSLLLLIHLMTLSPLPEMMLFTVCSLSELVTE